MFTAGSENYINKLRIVGDVDDALAFQLRLQSLLSSTDFSSPGVSPASVVCIRSLPDPRPRTLRLVRSELEGADVWSDALTKSIAGKVSSAARPATEALLNNADCVLFADRAEMLACVAADWLNGFFGRRWWWKLLLPAGDSSDVVKQFWRDNPQYLPAALNQLEHQRRAHEFVKTLADDTCREMLQRTIRTFAIYELRRACDVSVSLRSPFGEIFAKPPGRTGSASHSGEDQVSESPWEPWSTQPATPELSAEQQRFLGVALTIARAPSHARAPAFA